MNINLVIIKQGRSKIFTGEVNETNYLLVKLKLKLVYKQIVNILKRYKKRGLIKSLSRPRNKQRQDYLDKLVSAKREIKKSLNKLNKLF